MRTLVLNADYTPIDVVSWQRSLTLLLAEKPTAYAIELYNKTIRDSANRLYNIPAVIVLKEYVRLTSDKATYNRHNIFARDKYKCAYCGTQYKSENLTIDHVIPKSRWKTLGFSGSSSNFENVVTSCYVCNRKKRNRTPQEAAMPLLFKPVRLTRRQALMNRLLISTIHEKWIPYLESL